MNSKQIRCMQKINYFEKKEVGITIKSKATSSQLKPITRNIFAPACTDYFCLLPCTLLLNCTSSNIILWWILKWSSNLADHQTWPFINANIDVSVYHMMKKANNETLMWVHTRAWANINYWHPNILQFSLSKAQMFNSHTFSPFIFCMVKLLWLKY